MDRFKLVSLMLVSFIVVLFFVLFSAITGYFSFFTFNTSFYKCPDCNLILISIDTLRADHLGCYGYHRNTSPNIDQLAKEGILFENAFSQSYFTLPSHMSIFTSQYPSVHQMNDIENLSKYLPEYKTTLAEVLKKHGYTTVAFTGGGWVAPEFGFGQGFDNYTTINTFYKNTELLDNVFRWLDNNQDKKFFMFIHTYTVHAPYIPPKPFKGMFDNNYSGNIADTIKKMNSVCENKSCETPYEYFHSSINTSDPRDVYHVIALYDEGIRYVDYCIGKLLEKLKKLGLDRKTVIVLTSDHGEDLLEHGWIAEHHDLYDEQIHTPLIIKLPYNISKKVKKMVENIDIMPTVLHILDIPEKLSSMQGENVFSSLEKQEIFSEKSILCYSIYYQILSSMTNDKNKCKNISSYYGRKICLGQFNISFCESLPSDIKYACLRINHLHSIHNYTSSVRAQLIYQSILSNKTAHETCKYLKKESLKYPEPFNDVAIRTERYKYIYRYGKREDELYDLWEDPQEQHNIIHERPEVAKQLKNKILRWYEDVKKVVMKEQSEQSAGEIDQQTLEQLKSLGYLN